MINVAIMGYGTIGSGVAEVLDKNKKIITQKAGQEVALKYILDLKEFPGTAIADKVIHDFSVIEKDENVQIVVETMGGLNPSYPFVKACLEAGKHVVTSNKALVASYGTELLTIARERRVNFFFEASVGGGIPIIRPLYRCLMGEEIEEITGILNGTTNYILTKMDKERAPFSGVLKQAQDLGYAESNPEADVEGYDTCRKIAILTAMATGKEVNYEDIYTEGITKITDIDFRYAGKMGTSVKLFGTSRMKGGQVHAWVGPVMINKAHPLYQVNDVFNGILVKGSVLGASMFYGSGAGKLPTASAVIADIIEAAQNMNRNVALGWGDERLAIADMDQSCHRYFVRVSGSVDNRLATAKKIWGDLEVVTLEGMDEFAFLTKSMSEALYKEKKLATESAWRAAGGGGIRQMIRAELSC